MYLPPSYTENTLKVHKNVLVMHDGNNLFDPETAFMGNAWMIQDTLDPLIYEGQIEEVVIVAPYNTPGRGDEYTQSYDKEEGFGGKGDLYLDWIEQTLLPFAQKNLRITLDKGGRLGLAGSSLGGLISCYGAWTRSKTFGRAGCISSSFWWNNKDFLTTVMPTHPLTALNMPQLYLDAGTEETEIYQDTQIISQFMSTKAGFVLGKNL